MRTKITVIGILVLWGFSSAVHGQLNKIEFREFDMDNGLHVILHQDNSTPIVAVNITYLNRQANLLRSALGENGICRIVADIWGAVERNHH